jgi:predicted deacylase
MRSPISSEIDYEADGKQTGYLRLPHSVHRSAYGWIPIPIVQIKNGNGPTILLMAGNHGDEYEGQVAVTRLTKDLRPEMIHGRVILLPMANYPAAKVGYRTSPIDDGNLNRSFPGDPGGTVTQTIAHYIESVLLKMADYAIDLHSGGSSLHYVPTVLYGDREDAQEMAEVLRLTHAFAAPYALHFRRSGDIVSTAAARRQGTIAVTVEMGGSGTVTPYALKITQEGIERVMAEIGILKETNLGAPCKTRVLRLTGKHNYLYARQDGLFEPAAEIGEDVTEGQIAGWIHQPEAPWEEATEVVFQITATILCKRIPGRVQPGDCLFQLGQEDTD